MMKMEKSILSNMILGNFVHEKKLPPNFWATAIGIRQNSTGEEFIYLTGHQHHKYGAFLLSEIILMLMEFTEMFGLQDLLEELAITV